MPETDLDCEGQSREQPTQPCMVIGITSDQTCLVLRGRLAALRKAGFRVLLIASPGELLVQTALEEGVEACPVPMVRTIAPFADLISLLRICLVLWRERPVLTDFSTPKAGLLGNVAAWILRVPHRVYTLRGLKMESAHGWKRRLLLVLERLSAGCAEVVLCNSASLKDAALRFGIAPLEKLRILGDGSSNGVDTDRFSPGGSAVRASLNILPGQPVLGFVGRLTGDKGIPELLVAFERISRKQPEAWLLLVGWLDQAEDALDERCRELIRNHPRIYQTGYVEDTTAYYRAMDMLILATHREGFPNVALEAAACGVPVITTECTGARDAVIPEVTGILIPAENPTAIEDAAWKLLRDPDLGKQMGKAGRAWVMERFSRRRVLRLAVDFYQSLIA